MRKILLSFLSLVIFSSVLKSQNAIEIYNKDLQSVVGDTVTFWHGIDDDILYNDFEHKDFVSIVNKTNDTIEIGVRRYERTIIDSTLDYFCWNSCFDAQYSGSLPVWNVQDKVEVAPNDTAGGAQAYTVYFVPYYRDQNTGQRIGKNRRGEAVYEYEFYAGEAKSILFIKWSFSAITSLNEANDIEVSYKLYPNPAVNQTTLEFERPVLTNDNQLAIFDLMGKRVFEKNLVIGQQNEILDLSSFSKGIYFVSINAEGKVSKTTKLVVH